MKIGKFSVATIIAILIAIGGFKIFKFSEEAFSSCGDYGFISTPCEQLPTLAEVKKVLSSNKSEINRLKKISPNVYVSLKEQCSGKGIIVISHSSEKECTELRKVLQGNKFLGIPYKVINQ